MTSSTDSTPSLSLLMLRIFTLIRQLQTPKEKSLRYFSIKGYKMKPKWIAGIVIGCLLLYVGFCGAAAFGGLLAIDVGNFSGFTGTWMKDHFTVGYTEGGSISGKPDLNGNTWQVVGGESISEKFYDVKAKDVGATGSAYLNIDGSNSTQQRRDGYGFSLSSPGPWTPYTFPPRSNLEFKLRVNSWSAGSTIYGTPPVFSFSLYIKGQGWWPFAIFQTKITLGEQSFTLSEDTGIWHTWRLRYDMSNANAALWKVDVFRDSNQITTFNFIQATGLDNKLSCDDFSGSSTSPLQGEIDYMCMWEGLGEPDWSSGTQTGNLRVNCWSDTSHTQPLAGVTVSAVGPQSPAPQTTSTSGYVLFNLITVGSYTVTGTYNGQPKSQSGVVVNQGATATVNFDWTGSQTGTITVSAIDQNTANLNAYVQVKQGSTVITSGTTTTTFTLNVGSYDFVASYSQATDSPKTQSRTITAGTNTPMQFSFTVGTTPTTAQITVQVRDQNSAPISGATIIVRLNSQQVDSGSTGSTGDKTFTLTVGNYYAFEVQVSGEASQSSSRTIQTYNSPIPFIFDTSSGGGGFDPLRDILLAIRTFLDNPTARYGMLGLGALLTSVSSILFINPKFAKTIASAPPA